MIPASFQGRLRLPAVASPLFLISGPDLVVAQSKGGIVGSFPSLNQRTADGFEDWLKEIRRRLTDDDAPWAVNFSIHRTNRRLDEDMALTIKYQAPILISTLGITRDVVDAVHAYGGLVFHDVINMRHAARALEAGVDGIIAVCGGAGGHAGLYNPLAFVSELKPLMGKGTLILSGCIGDGQSLAGAIAMGADLGYIGTRFVNVTESMASDRMKQIVIDSHIDDIEYSAEVDGVGANWLRQTMPKHDLRKGGAVGTMDVTEVLGDHKRWRDILSAGQGVGSIRDIPTTSELIERMADEYSAAVDRLNKHFPSRGVAHQDVDRLHRMI